MEDESIKLKLACTSLVRRYPGSAVLLILVDSSKNETCIHDEFNKDPRNTRRMHDDTDQLIYAAEQVYPVPEPPRHHLAGRVKLLRSYLADIIQGVDQILREINESESNGIGNHPPSGFKSGWMGGAPVSYLNGDSDSEMNPAKLREMCDEYVRKDPANYAALFAFAQSAPGDSQYYPANSCSDGGNVAQPSRILCHPHEFSLFELAILYGNILAVIDTMHRIVNDTRCKYFIEEITRVSTRTTSQLTH